MHRHTFVPTAAVLTYLLLGTTVQAQTTWHIDDDNCPGPGSGTQSDPFCAIQAGIDAASDTDTVLVSPGTYSEIIDFSGKAITLQSTNGPDVTTIDGTGSNDSVVKCVSNEASDTVLDGFTITGGDTSYGGGMYNRDSTPTVANCVFTGNHAGTGGGMDNDRSSPSVAKCIFIDNVATNEGGGMSNYFGSPAVTSCSFIQNSADAYGGGVVNISGNVTFTNCLFAGNTATIEGGGLMNLRSSPTAVNCTIVQNIAAFGGGMYHTRTSSTAIRNCILWSNDGDSFGGSGTPDVTFSNIQGGYVGAGNIDDDPLFIDADGPDNIPGTGDENLRLSPGSPCINAGYNYIPDLPDDDIEGSPRIQNCRVDMGAYESSLGPAEPPDCDYSGEDDDCEIYDGRSEDCNQNTIPDQCDSFGDFDSDGEVDLKDFARFQRCFTGEDQSGLDDMCCFFDVEPDLDVDLDDYAEFESAFSE